VFPVKDNIPNRRFPVITALLILVNVVAYLLAVQHGGSLISGPDLHEVEKFGAIPYAFTHSGRHHPPGTTIPTWETVFTAMFLHASILHIAGNMLFLWIFGNNVEAALGSVKYVLVYLLAGVAALALIVATDPNSTAPTVGASGAIAGVLGAYIVIYPRAKILTLVFVFLFVTVVELPVWLMLAVWVAEQAVFAATNLTTPAGGGNVVAYFAAVGGLAFGLLVARLLGSRVRRPLAAA
jgi:membrane associated rhomboid family serine protease